MLILDRTKSYKFCELLCCLRSS